MKKLVLILVALVLMGFGWWNKRALFWFYWSVRNRPPHLEFTEYRTDPLRILYVKSPYLSKNIKAIAGRTLENLAQAEKVTGASLPELTLRVYNDYEEKGADAREITVAHADPDDNTIYCIVNEHLDGTRERLEYELLLRACCGKPYSPERGRIAAAALGGMWNQKPLEEWRSFLLQRNLYPAPEEAQDTSPFIRIPWNALRLQLLRSKYGWDALAAFYSKNIVPDGLDQLWKQAKDPAAQPAEPRQPFRPEFQKGISYAYDNSYSGGYATSKSRQSLDLLRKDHVEWIAAIPYGFMRSPDSTSIGTPGHSIFTESDESLFALSAFARARGMKVMLKPQLWVSHYSWTGMVDFKDEPSWDRWFGSYENWLLHYAIVAELTHADLLCIGTELVKTTLTHPDRWRKMITRIREVYHGPLVYAANYGEEFEKLQFWDALDYIGLDNYYAVRSDAKQGLNEMKAGFAQQKERVASVARKWNKPLLFTEIGYHANPGAGMGPKEEEIDGYDESMQADCYRLALETYWNEPWFYGMYWWKWFSNSDDVGKDADIHSPHGRIAEKVMADWYAKNRD